MKRKHKPTKNEAQMLPARPVPSQELVNEMVEEFRMRSKSCSELELAQNWHECADKLDRLATEVRLIPRKKLNAGQMLSDYIERVKSLHCKCSQGVECPRCRMLKRLEDLKESEPSIFANLAPMEKKNG